MTNPDWNLQVSIGHGRKDTGAHHRAINIAQQLLAADRWPDHLNTCIVIHNAYDAHSRLQMSGAGQYDAQYNVTVSPVVYDLILGQDYEIRLMTASFRQIHDL
jgi:hypothetical protein